MLEYHSKFCIEESLGYFFHFEKWPRIPWMTALKSYNFTTYFEVLLASSNETCFFFPLVVLHTDNREDSVSQAQPHTNPSVKFFLPVT